VSPATCEDAYMRLTGDSVEFRTHVPDLAGGEEILEQAA
jgi:hypothetical protein